MNILFLQDTDWIKRGPHQHHHILERLAQRGHEIRVIDYDLLWKDDENRKLIRERYVSIIEPKAIKDPKKIMVVRPTSIKMDYIDKVFIPPMYYFEIKRQIKDFHPDVIIGQCLLAPLVGLRLAKKYDIPFIFNVIDVHYKLIKDYVSPLFEGTAKRLERYLIRKADAVITINKKLDTFAKELSGRTKDIYIVEGGIDLPKYIEGMRSRDEYREKYGIDKKTTVLFFMGWIYDFTAMDRFIERFNTRYGKEGHLFLIVGEGDLYNKLRDMEKQHSNIILTGKVPYDEICKLLSMADICPLPYDDVEVMRHNVPIKIYEYLAEKKPVLCTDLPGIREEFGDNNGIIFYNDFDTMVKGYSELAPSKLKENGERGFQFVSRYSWEKQVDKFEKILMDIRR